MFAQTRRARSRNAVTLEIALAAHMFVADFHLVRRRRLTLDDSARGDAEQAMGVAPALLALALSLAALVLFGVLTAG